MLRASTRTLIAALVLALPAGAAAFPVGEHVEVFGSGSTDDGRAGEVISTLTGSERDVVAFDGSTDVKSIDRTNLRKVLPLPTASFTYAPSAPVTGQAVTFDASTSTCPASPCTYTWSVDGTVIGTGVTKTHTFATSGAKAVKLVVQDARVRSDSVTKTVTVAPPPPPSTTTELAQGKIATASSTATAGPPSNANDGNVATRWSSNYAASGEWWRVDLGAVAALSAVEVDWENATASPYSIQVSNDGNTWTTVATQTIAVDVTATATTFRTAIPAGTTGRFVRILQGGRGPGNCCYGMSFWEVRAYGEFTGGTTSPPQPTGAEGDVRVAKPHQQDMDPFTTSGNNGDTAIRTFYQTHYERLRYYDSPPQIYGTSWLPRGWLYKDAYAVYKTGTGAPTTPQYVLKDSSGNYTYVPFECGGGTCSQYAANICDPAFRDQWISAAVSRASLFKGTFVDDANIQFMVGDGSGSRSITVINYLDGTTLTADEWAECMTSFIEQYRAALPAEYEMVPNTVWFHYGGWTNPRVQRVVKASDTWEIERGFADPNLNATSFETLFNAIQYAHSQGVGVALDGSQYATGEQYMLGTYLCVSDGSDYVSGPKMTPSTWWLGPNADGDGKGWDTNLGAATSTCTKGADGKWRRAFTGGAVMVDPVAHTATITG